jgi:hypothetical protein
MVLSIPLHLACSPQSYNTTNCTAMATEKSVGVEHSNLETVHPPDANATAKSAVINDNIYEHQQTVLQVIRSHPALIWWAFFFSVSAIGW